MQSTEHMVQRVKSTTRIASSTFSACHLLLLESIRLNPPGLNPPVPIPVRTPITEPRNTGDFAESVTCLFHRKPRVPDSTRLWKLRCSFPLETELGNLSGTPNSMFLWYLQLEFYHTSFQPICGDLWLSSTVLSGRGAGQPEIWWQYP